MRTPTRPETSLTDPLAITTTTLNVRTGVRSGQSKVNHNQGSL